MKKIYTSFQDFNDTIPVLQGGKFFLESNDMAKSLQIQQVEDVIKIRRSKHHKLEPYVEDLIELLHNSLERDYSGGKGLKFWIEDTKSFLALMRDVYYDLGKLILKRERARSITVKILTRTIVEILDKTIKNIEIQSKDLEYSKLADIDIEKIKLEINRFVFNKFINIIKLCLLWNKVNDEQLLDDAANLLYDFRQEIIKDI